MAKDSPAALTAANKLYLYGLLSQRIGCGKQTFMTHVEAALAEERLTGEDLGFADTRALMEELDEFVQLTVFKGGRVYATVVAQPEWDAALAEPEEKKPAAKGNKPWKRKKGAKGLKPVRPRRVKRAEEAEEPVENATEPEAEAAVGPTVEAAAVSTAEPVDAPRDEDVPEPATAIEDEGESEPVAALEPEPAAAPTSAAAPTPAPVPAITLTVTYDPDEELAQINDAVLGSASDADPASAPSPEAAESAEGQAPAPASAPAPAAAPRPHAPAGERRDRSAASPDTAPSPEALASYPRDFHEEVRIPAEVLSELAAIMPLKSDVALVLEEDFRIARGLGTVLGTRARASFPLRFASPDGAPVRCGLKRTRGASAPWTVTGLEGTAAGLDLAPGLDGLPLAVDGPWFANAPESAAALGASPLRALGAFAYADEAELDELASLAHPAVWNAEALRIHLACALAQARVAGTIDFAPDGVRAAFPTGLFSRSGCPIAAVLAPTGDDIPWRLTSFE